MLNTEEKKKALQEIEFFLREYKRTDYMLAKLWREQHEIESAINERVHQILDKNNLIDRVKSFEGKKIMYGGDERHIEILNVSGVKLDKWEVRLNGEGVQIDDESIWKAYGITIKYDQLEKELEKITVVKEDMTYDMFVEAIESKRQLRIKEAKDFIDNKYDSMLKEFKKYYDAKEKDEELEIHSLDICGSSDLLDKISHVSMGRLKAYLLKVPDPDEKYDVREEDLPITGDKVQTAECNVLKEV